MTASFNAPRGTRDVFSNEIQYWQSLKAQVIELLQRFGYREIKTPIFEQTELFSRGIGSLTDIVEKEMYTFQDKKGRSLTLRPEGTASVVRAYLEHHLAREGLQKLYYQGPMFRYERPQAGRYRQFEQIGVEVIGSQQSVVDAQVIAMGVTICEHLGLSGITVSLNSVGCKVCRPVIREQFKSFIVSSLPHLCEDCQRRYEGNPLRILDCKKEGCRTYFSALPSTISVLCHECADHFNGVLEYLDAMKIAYAVDPFLVRGLDYYTKTVFEIQSTQLGAQNSVCGGGRYDELIAELGGPATPAFGLAFGVERLLMLLKEQQSLPLIPERKPRVYLVTIGELARRKAFCFYHQLCQRGIVAEMDWEGRSVKSQFKKAVDLGSAYAYVIGDAELESETGQLKELATGVQEPVGFEEILNFKF